MAKKKFLNLDNMNILWDNIDRNFLRREDIPYTEFEELLTESNTIIGAINELYRLIGEGNGIGDATISFSPNPINVAWDAEEATVQVTYSNHKSVLTPTEGLAWVDAIEEVNNSGNTYTYKISGITKNPSNTSITGKLKFGCNNLLGSPVYSEVSLVQAKAPAGTLTVTPTSKTIAAAGGNITFTVTFSNTEYYWVEKDTNATWVSIPSTSDSTSGGSTSNSYTVTVAANTDTASRPTHLVFKCRGHDSQDQNVKVTITQEAYVDDTPEVDTLPMYIGYIPYETLTANGLYNASGYGNLTEDVINLGVTNGEITKSDAKAVTTDYTSFGNVPQNAFSIIILPQSSGLTATKWNIIEDCVPFSVNPYSNGENTMTIAGETYLIFGQRAKYAWVVGNNEVYYKIK